MTKRKMSPPVPSIKMAASVLHARWRSELKAISTSNQRHPLHLYTSRGVFNKIVNARGESNVIITIERCSSLKDSPGGGRLFALLQVDLDFHETAESNDVENDSSFQPNGTIDASVYEEVNLYCSDKFLSHYGFKRKEKFYFTVAHSVALEKVVVGVSTERAFAWVKTDLFSRGSLLSVCQGKVLIRQNDNLLIPCSSLFLQDDAFTPDLFFDMKVLYTEPLCQGRLSVTTEIIILSQIIEPKNLDPILHITPRISDGSREVVNKPAQSKSDLNLKTIDVASLAGVSTSVTSKSIDSCKAPTRHAVFDLKEVPSAEKMFWHLKCNGPNVGVFDLQNTVGITQSALDHIGLNDGDVAEMYLYRPIQSSLQSEGDATGKIKQEEPTDKCKESTSKTKRMVIVKETKNLGSEGHIAYLPPSLKFNINKKSSYSCDNQVCIKKPPETLKEVSPDDLLDYASGWTWQEGIPYATEMHISLIRSPTYATSTDASQLLRDYFSQSRLVKKGDVLTISCKGDGDFCNELADGFRKPMIYFRVVRIHPTLPAIHTYWADIQCTVLFQDGALNHYIPAVMPMFLHADQSVLPPPGLTKKFHELKSILQPYLTHKRRSADPVPSALITGAVGCGKKWVSQSVAAALNLHIHVVNTFDLCGETSAAAEARVKALMTRVTSFAPCIVLLRNIHAFGKGADGNSEDPRTSSSFHEIIKNSLADQEKYPVLLIASTHIPKQVNADMYEGFLHQISIPAPNDIERREMLAGITGSSRSCCNINKARIAQRTAGFVLGDIHALVSHAHREAELRIKKKCLTSCHPAQKWQEEEDLVMAGVTVSQQDFETALDRLQAAHSDNIGAPKIPQVSWSDVGGLASVKADILDTIQLPLQHPELLAAGLRRSGVLLYGPPGTGKTLLAKAVATECSLNFMSVKGPELINMYVGQSEENVREVFQRARSAAPCVIFFDELDSLAPNRGRSGDSGGVMDRVVSQLLAELDGMSKSTDIFVIGATNRPDLLDPALLRPGRFDKLLYLGVSKDKQGQLKILTALTRKFHLTPGWSLSSVVESCPPNMTGADFYALCSDAMLNALKRKINLLEQGEDVCQDKIEVDIADFKEAVFNLVPSVSEAELLRYKLIQNQFTEQPL